MGTIGGDRLLEALERHWESREFRPLQRETIEAVLDRRDVAVVMPTGGGKSLCYQMPVLFLPGTAVVVSPLIALMKDQVERLTQRGIRAAALNSSTPYPEQHRIHREIREGTLRLLYIAPERLLREDTVELIRHTPVCYYAIDEAHCISEWGHEFRPDYRRLSELRQWHPEAPILALTASATRRVRHDILTQLGMRDPAKFIRSFERKNLRYMARQTDGQTQWRLLEAALQAHARRSVIVYASTIAVVEQTARQLNQRGIGAVAYHAQLPPERRRAAQERWMAGDPPVLVGTIAFGMGIDKPDVRAVIHLSLPKSVEQYYQEAGRAGRDGEPSDCLLLWQAADAGVIAYFIKQMGDEEERRRAWRRYHDIRGYAQSVMCRHVTICRHFGEPVPSRICGMCDVCGPVPEWYEQLYQRVPQPEAIRPHAPVRKPRREKVAAPAAAATPASEAVFGRLRAWRLQLARREKVPPYVIFHDSVLRSIAAARPADLHTLANISGLGPVKLEKYGAEVLKVVQPSDS
ncbi:MAG: RecQ family ATP-dependent DNA helicase [Acidobacteria bacterium]|nr:RecQ family ATP-dependent DNA helicase [Acidobacteriota bacterium]